MNSTHDGQQPLDLSVVIPVMNEAESVLDLAREVAEAMQAAALSWECVWVDDGSTDATGQMLDELSQREPCHRVLHMARNYGQSAALTTGFRAARAPVVGSLDGDGQNDPADLPKLLQVLRQEDVAMVNGVRAKRRDNWVRKLSSRLANGFRNWVTHERVTDVGCAIRVVRRECVQQIPVFKGTHRFLPTLVRMQGYTITERPVNHRARVKGFTKYGIGNRLWVGLADTVAVRWMQCRLVWPQTRRED